MVLLYMVTWIPSIYPSHVSIYTSTMDPMGKHDPRKNMEAKSGSACLMKSPLGDWLTPVPCMQWRRLELQWPSGNLEGRAGTCAALDNEEFNPCGPLIMIPGMVGLIPMNYHSSVFSSLLIRRLN